MHMPQEPVQMPVALVSMQDDLIAQLTQAGREASDMVLLQMELPQQQQPAGTEQPEHMVSLISHSILIIFLTYNRTSTINQ